MLLFHIWINIQIYWSDVILNGATSHCVMSSELLSTWTARTGAFFFVRIPSAFREQCAFLLSVSVWL